MSSMLGDPTVDERWEHFQKLWESTVSIVARWIRDNGGWVSHQVPINSLPWQFEH